MLKGYIDIIILSMRVAAFDDFVKPFDGFGVEEYMVQWYRDNGESIGLFYAAFLIFGLTVGGHVGLSFGTHLRKFRHQACRGFRLRHRLRPFKPCGYRIDQTEMNRLKAHELCHWNT